MLVLTAALIEANAGAGRPWATALGLLAGYALAMVLPVRLRSRHGSPGRLHPRGPGILGVAAVAVASGWATAELGLHAVIGAFLVGLLMPRREGGEADAELVAPIRPVGVAMLPLFSPCRASPRTSARCGRATSVRWWRPARSR